MDNYYLHVSVVLLLILPFSFQYMDYSIEQPGFCPPFRNNSIKLGAKDKSSMHVQQTTLNNHSIPWTEYSCKLDITASSHDEGLIAVIQNLALRKNAETGECIDYVQFTKLDGTRTKYCGISHAIDLFNEKKTQTRNLWSVIEHSSYLHVEIFISEQAPKPFEKMELDFTITAFKFCENVMGHTRMKYKPCTSSPNYCIYIDFHYDKNIHCPLSSCIDDLNCYDVQKPQFNPSIGQRVIIGSLSTLFLLFLIFILFLWYSRTYKIFCWAHHFATNSLATPTTVTPNAPPHGSEENSSSRVIEMSERQARTTSSQGNVANSVDEDKDMPPSYESLFPR